MDEPYTRPDEDPFCSQSVLEHLHERRTRQERNSVLHSWLNSSSEYGLGSSSNPYLAYPDLPRMPQRHRTDSSSSYDLIDHDDIPHDFVNPRPSPRSFISLFTPPRHTRSSSSSSVPCSTPTPTKRRSFLPHFVHSPSDTLPLPPPRPSFSSSTSSLRAFSSPAMSTSTLDSIGLPDTPTKSTRSFFHSIRSRNGIRSSSKDTRPYPTHALSNITDADNDQDSNIDNFDFLPPPSNRFSRASSQTSFSASSHLPSSSHLPISKRERDKLYLSSLTRPGKKKRKLIVSGIGVTEVRKFDGVKRWCETFGEIRSITRLPNGDLQIDFRDPEVADSVCRIRAKVFIAGVGSVQLSWIMGNKR